MQNKTSFHQYVQSKLYDAIFRGVDAYVKENSDKLDLTSRRIYDIEEVYLDDIEIKHVNVEDKEGMRVDFFPIVNATVAFSGRGKYDVEEDSKTFISACIAPAISPSIWRISPSGVLRNSTAAARCHTLCRTALSRT